MASQRTKNVLMAAAIAGQVAAIAASPLFAEAPKTGCAPVERPRIDLAFCIDTTGSMSGEIENVKSKTKELVAKLAGGKPAPIIRVGMVAYRDQGDEYLTKVFPFSDDIDKVVNDISSLRADGGGDQPEAVSSALHSSLNDLSWSSDKKTLKLLFLIGDAEPNASDNTYDWKTEAKSAISRGIQINTLGCQGLEQGDGVNVFQQIAKLSDGRYESLAYRTEVVNAKGETETVIASGGSMYRVKNKAADWKSGAATLSARGDAERIVAPSLAGAGLAMEAYGAADGAAAPMAMGFSPGRASRAAGGYGGAFAPSSVPRADNNLADVVLNATKEAAAKKLNVNFEAK